MKVSLWLYLYVTCCPPVYATELIQAAIPAQLPPDVGVDDGALLVELVAGGDVVVVAGLEVED